MVYTESVVGKRKPRPSSKQNKERIKIMATKNIAWFNTFSAKYGVQFQIIKGNKDTVHVAIIGGEQYNNLAQLKKAQVEKLFKDISMGKTSDMKNTVSVTRTGNVKVNGTNHKFLDIIRGIKVSKLLEILDNSRKDAAFYEFCNWLVDDKNRREYLKTIKGNDLWQDYLRLEYYFQTGEAQRVNQDDLFDAWIALADDLAYDEGVELIECDEDDDFSDLKYPVGI